MKDFNLKLYLKDHLKKRDNRDFLQYLADVKPYLVGHHIIGKRNDLLIAKITDADHKKVHNATSDAMFFEELLIDALENAFDYIEYLQKKEELDKLSELF